MNGAEKIAALKLELKTLEERQDRIKIEIRYELEILNGKKVEATLLKEIKPPVSAAALLVDMLVVLRDEIEFYAGQAQEHGLPTYKLEKPLE